MLEWRNKSITGLLKEGDTAILDIDKFAPEEDHHFTKAKREAMKISVEDLRKIYQSIEGQVINLKKVKTINLVQMGLVLLNMRKIFIYMGH